MVALPQHTEQFMNETRPQTGPHTPKTPPRRLGVVLAGGQATRLPNKPLLPIGNARLLIESAIDFAAEHCDQVVVVQPGNPAIEYALRCVWRSYAGPGYNAEVVFATQHSPRGVPDAIRAGYEYAKGEWDRVLVTFCDNMYDDFSGPDGFTRDEKLSYASVVVIDDENERSQLDAYDDGQWCHRASPQRPDTPRFAGWLDLTVEAVQGLQVEELMGWMNYHDVVGVVMPRGGWADLGTLDSYCAYLLRKTNDV